MACFIIGAGSFYGLPVSVQRTDMVIAADGGWHTCRENGITPTLLVADFDSLDAAPAFDHILRLPVEKDDTDMIRAVKEGFDRGEREFHLLGGMGGHRTDHTVANMQTLAYIARRGGQGWLYGNGERFTAICDGGEITLRAEQRFLRVLPGRRRGGRYHRERQVSADRRRADGGFPSGGQQSFYRTGGARRGAAWLPAYRDNR